MTVEAILEATAQILSKDGREALTTNRIAERAGVSIGTLYQYFPNKQAILVEIARREIERDRSVVLQVIGAAAKDDHIDPARLGIRSLIASQTKQTKVRRAAFDALAGEGLARFGMEGVAAFQAVTDAMQQNRAWMFGEGARQPTQPMLYVISRAVAGVIRSAIVEKSGLLGTPELENELVRLVKTYFASR